MPRREVSTTDHEFLVALPSTDAAPAMARHLIAAACRGRPQQAVDIALILTSELVTNAVRHGSEPISLGISLAHGVLHVNVHDGSRVAPRPAPDGQPDGQPDGEPDSEHGRGLLIVAELASDWGARSRAGSPGKIVWFDLRLD